MASGFDGPNTDQGGADFAARIRMLIGGDSVRSCASKWGVPEGSLRQYLGGSEPGLEKVIAIAQAAGVSVEWLATGRLAVPVVGLAACGLEGWYQERRLALTAKAPDGASPRCFAVIATGESMIPVGINPGDAVIVDAGVDAQAGQIALVELMDGSAAIKRFGGYDGEWALLEGWLPPDDGPQRPYVDRRRRDQINRIIPMVAVQPGLAGFDQTTGQGKMHPVSTEAAGHLSEAVDEELLARVGEEVVELYRQENGRISQRQLARLQARLYSDLVAAYDDQAERLVGLKGMIQQLRRDLRTPASGSDAGKRLA